jgi:hypothetical protein
MAPAGPIVAAGLALALLLPSPAARADDRPEPSTAIYKVNLAIDIPLIAAGAIGTAIPYLMSETIVDPHCPCNAQNLNSFDRPSVGNHSDVAGIIGNVLVTVAVAAPLVIELVDVRPMRTLIEDLTVYAEAMAVNGGLMALSKFTVQRPTPKAYAGDPAVIDRPGGYLSFYSGHTSFAFTSLSFGSVTAAIRYQHYFFPWVITGVVGGSVAAAMVLAGEHFPLDVTMGAVAGTVIGVSVPLLHRRGGLHLALQPERDGKILSLRGRF